jgi:hypothetical protein
MFLPTDVARCIGKPAGPNGVNYAPECELCLRRRAPRPNGLVRFMDPPKTEPCPDKIPVELMGS